MLHLYAALAEKERSLIATRTLAALQAVKGRGVRLGNRTNLAEAGRHTSDPSSQTKPGSQKPPNWS